MNKHTYAHTHLHTHAQTCKYLQLTIIKITYKCMLLLVSNNFEFTNGNFQIII
jgi:hypothetical protein